MAMSASATFTDRLPDTVEIRSAAQLRQIVASQIRDESESTQLSLALEGGEVQTVTLSPALTKSLLEVLRLVSSGCGFHLIPVDAALTTQQAADLLNVSRPYFIKLLENGEIPFTKVGRHRRVRAENLFDYRRKRDQERSDALSSIARMDAEGELI